MSASHAQKLLDADRQLFCSSRSTSSRVPTTADDSGYTDTHAPSLPDAGASSSGDVDWYGNNPLHHAFATSEVDIKAVTAIIDSFPQYASQRNQFGRIPLHYALDRIRVHLSGLRLLLKVYPDGVTVADIDNKTPYDIARKWKHSRTIKKLLLDIAPSLDRNTHLLLTYGPLANLAIWASSITKLDADGRCRVTHYDDANRFNEEDDYVNGKYLEGEGEEEGGGEVDGVSSFHDSPKLQEPRTIDGMMGDKDAKSVAAEEEERLLEIKDVSSK